MRQLLAAELGDVLRDAARAHATNATAGDWRDALLTADSPLRSLDARPVDVVGIEEPDPVEMDRLRSATRPAPTRRRWLDAWRRSRRRRTASAGTADNI